MQADLADAPEQTVDPLDQGTSSAIASEQTTITLPQGKVSIIKLLPMNLYINIVITLSIFS